MRGSLQTRYMQWQRTRIRYHDIIILGFPGSGSIIYGDLEFDDRANYHDAKERKLDILIKPRGVEARGALRSAYME